MSCTSTSGPARANGCTLPHYGEATKGNFRTPMLSRKRGRYLTSYCRLVGRTVSVRSARVARASTKIAPVNALTARIEDGVENASHVSPTLTSNKGRHVLTTLKCRRRSPSLIELARRSASLSNHSFGLQLGGVQIAKDRGTCGHPPRNSVFLVAVVREVDGVIKVEAQLLVPLPARSYL